MTLSRACYGILAVVLLMGLSGCGGAPALERTAVSGKVTVGGAPLAAGRILFIPISPTTGPVTSAVITQGAYKLDKEHGPIVGRHRVEVEAELALGFALDDDLAFARRGGAPLPPNPIPPQFNRQSQLVTEFSADRDHVYDVTVPAARR